MGGTFDPPHYAHLRLAEEAREALGLDSVRWIPSGQPGHRGAPATAAAHRLEMVKLAIAGQPAFTLDDAEVRSPRSDVHRSTHWRGCAPSSVPTCRW